MKRVIVESKSLEIAEILKRGGNFSSKELAKEMGIPKDIIPKCVASLRSSFRHGKFDTWIYTTKIGYSTDKREEYIAYHSMRVIKQGFGNLVNGLPVLQEFKRLPSGTFGKVKIEYKPKMIMLDKLFVK